MARVQKPNRQEPTGMTDEYSRWQRLVRRIRKGDKKTDRWMRKHLRRGFGYRVSIYLASGLIVLLAIIFGLILVVFAQTERIVLDANTIASIMVADIPVGVFLWLAFQRRESENRKLLDAVEITEAPTRYAHLEVHQCDDYEDGIYPELLYYIVNTKSKRAYWVDEKIEELIEARIIRQFPKHRDVQELNRHFEVQHYVHASGYPQGDDLFRDVPPKDEV